MLAEEERRGAGCEFPLALAAATSASSLAAATSAASLCPVWQDLFRCIRRSHAPSYMAALACAAPAAAEEEDASSSEESAGDDAGTRNLVLSRYLTPEALVQRHRLGAAEVCRLYTALQVYSLGFHQTVLELTAHARDKGPLLLATWRALAMLWDGALQVVFPSQVVRLSQERQAALLTSQHLLEALRSAEAAATQLAADRAAAEAAAEAAGVEAVAAAADGAAALRRVGELEAHLERRAAERKELGAQLEATRRELRAAQARLLAVGAPAHELVDRAEQAERLAAHKEGLLGAAARQAGEAQVAREAAQQRSAVEQAGRQAAAEEVAAALQAQLDEALCELAAMKDEAAQQAAQAAEQAAAGEWRQRAEAADAAVAALQAQLRAAEQEKDGLVASMYPLVERVKRLVAQLQQAAAGGGGAATGAG